MCLEEASRWLVNHWYDEGGKKIKQVSWRGSSRVLNRVHQQDLWKWQDERSVLVSMLKKLRERPEMQQRRISAVSSRTETNTELGANSLQSAEIPVEPHLSVRPSPKGTRRDSRWCSRWSHLHLELLCHTSSTLHYCLAALKRALSHSHILLCHSRHPHAILQFVSWHSFSNCRSIKEMPSVSVLFTTLTSHIDFQYSLWCLCWISHTYITLYVVVTKTEE